MISWYDLLPNSIVISLMEKFLKQNNSLGLVFSVLLIFNQFFAGLLEAGFFELNKLQPTPFKVKNILIPSLYVDRPADIQVSVKVTPLILV